MKKTNIYSSNGRWHRLFPATGDRSSPHGLDTTRGRSGRQADASADTSCPERDSVFEMGAAFHSPILSSHLCLRTFMVGCSRPPWALLDSPVRKCILVLALCSSFQPSLIPGASENVPGTTPQGGHGPGPLLASQLQPPPVSLPQGLTLLALGAGTGYLWGGRETCLGHTSVPCSCALCPRESPLASASCGKEPPPGNSCPRRPESKKERVPGGQVKLHPPLRSLSASPSSLFSPLPCPHGSQKPSPPAATPGLGSSSPVEPGG